MSAIKEQFIAKVKNSKGSQTEKLIEELISSEIFNFYDFLSLPSVSQLNKTKDVNKYYNTLNLFASYTYYDYKKDSSKYLALKDKALNNLKCVSIQEMAKTKKHLNFSELKRSLDIKTDFDLESILYTSISNDLFVGKVDSLNKCVDVFSIKPRNNMKGIKEAEKMIDKWIGNINDAMDFGREEEERIMKETTCNKKLLNISGGK